MTGPLLRRLRAARATPTARDAALGAVVGVLTLVLFLVVERVAFDEVVAPLVGQAADAGHLGTRGRLAVVGVIVAQAMLLTLRRRSPLLCLALVAAAQVALVAVLPPLMTFQAPATLVAAYSVGAYLPRRGALGWSGAAAVVQTVLAFVLTGPVPEHLPAAGTAATQLWTGLLSAVLAYVAATAVGVYVGTRRELETQLRERVEQAEREREALAARAVLEERGRMARELHDVAAHHLSGIVVQAAAAERLVGTDPDRARESLRWIRTQGRSTLDDLRLVVGLLRSGDRADGRDGDAPQPTLDDLPALLTLARSTGADVRHEVRGTEQDLPPNAQRTVYRVLQESLANARRHAPGQPVTVVVDHRPDEVVLTVRNRVVVPGDGPAAAGRPAEGRPGRAAPPGHGIIGMSERAALVGGTLQASVTPDGAWLVRLAVPREAPTGRAAPGTETLQEPTRPGVGQEAS
ncbi:signal transduction histidine kinase [Isoptericola sp. CG 20/1183]|uniref:histidine kinase n=1 Tax=Isoptericola halotolerans TaxID=300560 RepID=A0ABX5EI55_9MICO|nr:MULTISPECIES: histidine kinase [Isoptericola]PRZ09365.1 signal transduction histidine kinase [Isoptericola sp. CG 20/1183]PRZ10166.1 signal transduction histidine kinase [Isoptericola halotolerans]